MDFRSIVIRHLKVKPLTSEELVKLCLGVKAGPEHDTRYMAYYRALQSLLKDGTVEDAKYRLLGEVADQKTIGSSIQKFLQSTSTERQILLMEDIEAECRKREAILTPRLLLFLKHKLSEKNKDIRGLAISSLRHIQSKLDDGRRTDLRLLKRMRKEYTPRLLEITTNDSSFENRTDAFKLLLELGEDKLTEVVVDMLRFEPEQFAYLRSLLVTDLCRRYDADAFAKNRYLRDRKDKLRTSLQDLAVSQDARLVKRAKFILHHIRFGPSNPWPGELDVS